ncbi:MAG: diguanylate cyclase [Arenibacterium sp.]
MQGTILIIDAIATNRIMLKVQLSAAYYHVVQTDRVKGLATLVQRVQPDLIVSAMSLPDGTAIDVHNALQKTTGSEDIPVLAVTGENDNPARLRALDAGLQDVMSHPIDDKLLQARIRSLIRAHAGSDDLPLHATGRTGFAPPGSIGLNEFASDFAPLSRVALITQRAATSNAWHNALRDHFEGPVRFQEKHDALDAGADQIADAYVVEITDDPSRGGLNMLADLRARTGTRNAAVIAVVTPPDASLAAEALDRGAHDVLQSGFCARELALRLRAQLRLKARSDQMRASVLNGLRAAVVDPMTGLYNRRYAMPHLNRVVEEASFSDSNFAVMIADLDHFKKINDKYGHQTGDAVLVEAAMRLRQRLRPCDMIARIGGEEFLIVLPDTDKRSAIRAADRLCRQINATPFWVRGASQSIPVTISIGIVVGNPAKSTPSDPKRNASNLIDQADRALYEAKNGGRNKVTLVPPAA